MRAARMVGILLLVLWALTTAGCADVAWGAGPLFLGLFLVLTTVTAGCDQGRPVPCCDSWPSTEAIGHVSTCRCPAGAICNFAPYIECEDDAGEGDRCISYARGSAGAVTGLGLRCFDPEGPTVARECCDADPGGFGEIVACRCPVFGDCAWGTIGSTAWACDETLCVVAAPVTGAPSCPVPEADGGDVDAGLASDG